MILANEAGNSAPILCSVVANSSAQFDAVIRRS